MFATEDIYVGELIIQEKPLFSYFYNIFNQADKFKEAIDKISDESQEKIVELNINEEESKILLHSIYLANLNDD